MQDPFLKFLLLSIGFFFLIACHNNKNEKKPDTNAPVIVDVIIASVTPISKEIETSGSIVATEYAELHPEVSGRLTYLHVPEGKTVKVGTIIAKVNNADLQAQFLKAKSQYELALKTGDRLSKLLSVSGVNQADYDIAVGNINSYKSDMDYSQAMIDKTIIKAPFTGEMGLRQVSPGSYVTPSTIIATIQQLNQLKIDFNVPEEYGNLLNVGRIVEVEPDAGGKKRRKAVILAVEPQVNATSRNLKVRALLKDGTANPGAFVKIYLTSGEDKSSIMVPSEAIIPEDLNKLLVIVKEGKAKFVKIETGERLAGGIEVTYGIAPGDTIIVSGILFVRPDSPVKIRQIKKYDIVKK